MQLQPKLTMCGPEELAKLHEASLKLLAETGVVFHEPEALEVFKKNGAKVDGEIVYISADMVEKALKSTPSSWHWQAQDDANSLTAGNGPLLGAMVSAVEIIEYDGSRRPSALKDVRQIIQSSQASQYMNFVTSMVVEANDVAPDHRHLFVTYETLKHCTKPFGAYNILPNGQRAAEILNMAEIVFGTLKPGSKTPILLSATPASPLKYEQSTIQCIMEFARRGQAVALSPCALGGLSAPIDYIGSSLLQNVEILAGLVLIQLINPGNPVVYHVSNHTANFKAATSSWGSPEYALIILPNLELAKRVYNLPIRVCSAPTTARAVDYMAAMETAHSMLAMVLGGVDLVYCSAGTLENLKGYSYEKQILDEEIFSRAKKMYDGITFTDETLSVDLIKTVGHGGNYLTQSATVKKCRKNWAPLVSNYDLSDTSKADILQNAHNICKARLEAAPESQISPGIDADLQKYMKKTLNLS